MILWFYGYDSVIFTTRNLQFIRWRFCDFMAMILWFSRREILISDDEDSVIVWLWFCDFHDQKSSIRTMTILWFYFYDSVIYTTRNLQFRRWGFCDFVVMIPWFSRRDIFKSYNEDSAIFWLCFRDFHDEESSIHTITIPWFYGYNSVIFTTRYLQFIRWWFCDFMAMILWFSRREIFNSYDDDSVILWLWFCDFHDEKY